MINAGVAQLVEQRFRKAKVGSSNLPTSSMRQYRISRLAKKQEIKSLRKAVIFFLLSLGLILALIFLGIPLLIKFAIFIGNIRSSYTPNETENVIPPPPPRFKQTFEATNSAVIRLEGYADPDSLIDLYVSGIPQVKTSSKSDGTFVINNFKLTPGRNEISATVTDKSGKTSQLSRVIDIELDNIPPNLTIISPTNNSTYYGGNNRVEIKGETDEATTITINDRFVIVDSRGEFNYPFILSLGENKIKIMAIDKAGNQKEEELTLKLE